MPESCSESRFRDLYDRLLIKMLIEMKGGHPRNLDALSLASTTTGGEVRLDKAAVVGCASQHKFEAMVVA
jgi:hypothetical protein